MGPWGHPVNRDCRQQYRLCTHLLYLGGIITTIPITCAYAVITGPMVPIDPIVLSAGLHISSLRKIRSSVYLMPCLRAAKVGSMLKGR
jgi:hypothetical protein